MASDPPDSDHFARSVAYSTGLRLGRALGEILSALMRALASKGDRMSTVESELRQALDEITEPTAKAEVRRVLAELPTAFVLADMLEVLDEREHLRRGLASAIHEPLISQEAVEAWVEQWAQEEPAMATDELGTTTLGEELPNDREQIEHTLDYEVSTSRDEVLKVLNDLPDDCTLDDILHTLYVRLEIKQGIWSLDNEPTFTQAEVEQSLSRWLTN